MSIFDGLTQTYTFQLRIERNGQTILDTAIAAKPNAAEMAKVKKTIQRLLNEYTPAIQPSKPTTAPEPVQPDTPAQPEPEGQGGPAQAQEMEQQPEGPAEDAVPQGAGPAHERPPQGTRGLLRLRCGECGSTFGTFLRDFQTEITCKCGQPIDLTAPLARYHFICPYCEKETRGRTNLEDPEITIRCKCGGDIDLRWNPKEREYQN